MEFEFFDPETLGIIVLVVLILIISGVQFLCALRALRRKNHYVTSRQLIKIWQKRDQK